jgi:hypothetical protein
MVSAAEQRLENGQSFEIKSEAVKADPSDSELGSSIWLGG